MFDIGSYFPPAIKRICIACVSVFSGARTVRFAFSRCRRGISGLRGSVWFPTRGDSRIPIWQLFTYIFLHGGILHILFNLLYLCMFGADLERAWGSRKFYTYFFICGVGAGVDGRNCENDCWTRTGAGSALVPTIGASGAIYGVLLAVAVIMPHRQVWVFPLPVTVSMRVFVIVMGAIEFFGTIGVGRRQR